MSIQLNSIDCPYLTNDCLKILQEKYSISTTNDFLFWLIKAANSNEYLTADTIDCIQSCVLAHTGQILSRQMNKTIFYRLNFDLFDRENLLKNARHLIFIYENFSQYQWNEFFSNFLRRLYFFNSSISIKYLNTNISLFAFEENPKFFDYQYCFNLETFEIQLDRLESNAHSIQILIIDDFFQFIKPYLNLDRRIKTKIYQLTSRLNRLAQKQSILILNGLIFPSKETFECFHADQYVLIQTISSNDLQIFYQNQVFQLNLEQWKHF